MEKRTYLFWMSSHTIDHLMNFIKDKTKTFEVLNFYIKTTPKTIVLDALLSNEYIKLFHGHEKKNRYIDYAYKKWENKTVKFLNSKELLIKKIESYLKDNKKIIVCSNSKVFIMNIYNYLQKQKIEKILRITSDDPFKEKKWEDYNVVLYSPVITAGISFDKEHFDTCFCFFTDNSSLPNSAFQQMFRVRNFKDDNIFVHINQKKNIFYPVSFSSICEYIKNK